MHKQKQLMFVLNHQYICSFWEYFFFYQTLYKYSTMSLNCVITEWFDIRFFFMQNVCKGFLIIYNVSINYM